MGAVPFENFTSQLVPEHAKKSEKAQFFIDRQTFRRDENSPAGIDRDEVEANQLGGLTLIAQLPRPLRKT
jgi:hypothetical protein